MIGERIKSLRQIAKMTQQDLAIKLKISPSAVGMYEQNRREPSNEVIMNLCNIFDITSDWLLLGGDLPLNQRSRYNSSGSEDLGGVLDSLRDNLKKQEGLMFKGKMLDKDDIEKIFDAMRLGAEIAALQKPNKRENHDDEV